MTTQANNTQIANPKLTLGVFCFLFLIRLVSGYLQATQGNGRPVFTYLYLVLSLVFITIVIWFNKENISELKVDRYFIYIFILSDILLFFCFGLSLLGIAAIACVVLVFRAFLTRRFAFNYKEHNHSIIFLVVLGIVPVIFLKLLAQEPATYIDLYLKLNIGKIFTIITVRLWDVIFEEMLFRGILWAILAKWNFSNRKIAITQAFLFWLVHLNYMLGASFGVVTFLVGLWLGFLVLRSKSLVPSAVTHFVWNIASNF